VASPRQGESGKRHVGKESSHPDKIARNGFLRQLGPVRGRSELSQTTGGEDRISTQPAVLSPLYAATASRLRILTRL
jgi:hypothetical protein